MTSRTRQPSPSVMPLHGEKNEYYLVTCAYVLQESALNMLIKLYAGEQAATHFTALAPGLVDTAMQDYLTKLPEDRRYEPLETLKAAKGTEKMPDSETCARRLIDAFPRLRENESGNYADIRKLSSKVK